MIKEVEVVMLNGISPEEKQIFFEVMGKIRNNIIQNEKEDIRKQI